MDERRVLMAVVGKAHGVRGQVRVNCFAEDAASLEHYTLQDRAGRAFRLRWAHENVAELSELTPAGLRAIGSRNAAEALINTELFVPRSALPEPEDEAFYFSDLVGLTARGENGEILGTVSAVHDFGAGSSLELSPGGRLIPFTRAAVPHIDLATGQVVIIPPEEVTAAP